MTVLDAIPVSESIELRALARPDIGRFWEMIEGNRAHLETWFTWAESATFESTHDFLEEQIVQHAEGRMANYGIWWNGRLAGKIDLRNLEAPAETNVGYFLAAFARGNGVMTASLRALARAAFTSLSVYRIELVAALGNMESRRVAERAGFAFEGIARARVIVHGKLHDAAVYARISTDP